MNMNWTEWHFFADIWVFVHYFPRCIFLVVLHSVLSFFPLLTTQVYKRKRNLPLISLSIFIFYVWCQRMNLGPHAWKANALLPTYMWPQCSFPYTSRGKLPLFLPDINIPNSSYYFSLVKQYVVLVEISSLIPFLFFNYTVFNDIEHEPSSTDSMFQAWSGQKRPLPSIFKNLLWFGGRLPASFLFWLHFWHPVSLSVSLFVSYVPIKHHLTHHEYIIFYICAKCKTLSSLSAQCHLVRSDAPISFT